MLVRAEDDVQAAHLFLASQRGIQPWRIARVVRQVPVKSEGPILSLEHEACWPNHQRATAPRGTAVVWISTAMFRKPRPPERNQGTRSIISSGGPLDVHPL